MIVTSKSPAVYRTVLPNGLLVIAVENPSADIIAGRIFIRAGTLYEPGDQAGAFSMLASLLTRGTSRLSAFEIAEQVESIGASLGADASADYSLFSLKTVSADFPDMLALAGELLRDPSLPDAEIDLERRLTLQNLRSMNEQPFTVAFNQLRETMYGDHPYALPSLGTEASVSAFNAEGLRSLHQTYFRPDNMVVCIVGRIHPDEAVQLVEHVFGDWQPPAMALPPIPERMPLVEPQRVILPQETNQSIVMVGYLAASVRQSAYPALKLLSTYLGNGLSSRLFVELREKRGLAYDVSAFYPTRLSASQFVTYIGTAPENTAVALEGLLMEVQRLRDQPLSEQELQTAKNKLLGQYALSKQTNSQIAQTLGWYEILGLGMEFDQTFQEAIAAVTAEEAQTVAFKYLSDSYVVMVGPAEAVEPLRG